MKHFLSIVFFTFIVITLGIMPLNKIAAQAPAFTISSFGYFQGTSNVSSPVLFSSPDACIQVQSGIAVLESERGTGVLDLSCAMPANINTLGIKLFPNPAHNYIIIKFDKTPPITQTFTVTVVSMNGVVVSSGKATGYNLFNGHSVDVSMMAAGTYVLKLESDNYVDAVKFIKAN